MQFANLVFTHEKNSILPIELFKRMMKNPKVELFPFFFFPVIPFHCKCYFKCYILNFRYILYNVTLLINI